MRLNSPLVDGQLCFIIVTTDDAFQSTTLGKQRSGVAQKAGEIVMQERLRRPREHLQIDGRLAVSARKIDGRQPSLWQPDSTWFAQAKKAVKVVWYYATYGNGTPDGNPSRGCAFVIIEECYFLL